MPIKIKRRRTSRVLRPVPQPVQPPTPRDAVPDSYFDWQDVLAFNVMREDDLEVGDIHYTRPLTEEDATAHGSLHYFPGENGPIYRTTSIPVVLTADGVVIVHDFVTERGAVDRDLLRDHSAVLRAELAAWASDVTGAAVSPEAFPVLAFCVTLKRREGPRIDEPIVYRDELRDAAQRVREVERHHRVSVVARHDHAVLMRALREHLSELPDLDFRLPDWALSEGTERSFD